MIACLAKAHPRRSRMTRNFEAFAGVRYLSTLHLKDRKVLIDIVADIEIPAVWGEADRLGHPADLDVLQMCHTCAIDLQDRDRSGVVVKISCSGRIAAAQDR